MRTRSRSRRWNSALALRRSRKTRRLPGVERPEGRALLSRAPAIMTVSASVPGADYGESATSYAGTGVMGDPGDEIGDGGRATTALMGRPTGFHANDLDRC